MKKIFILIILIIPLLTVRADALDFDGELSLSPYTPSELDKITNGDIEKYSSDIVSGRGDLVNDIKKTAEKYIPDIKGAFFTLLCALILSGVISSLKSSFSCDNDVCELAGVAVCAILLFTLMKTSFDTVKICLESSVTFMTGMLAIACTVYGTVGNIAGAHIATSTLGAVLWGIQSVTSYFLFPAVGAVFGMSLANSFKEDKHLSELSSSVKKTAVFVLSLCGFVCSLSLGISGAFSSVSDGIMKKGVKFAAGSFVPIIGSSLSDAYDAVYLSIASLKISAGVSGIIVLLLTFAPPVLCLCAVKLMIYTSGIISRSLLLEKQSRLMDSCGDILSVMIALCLFSFVVFTVFCGTFMRVTA